MQKISKTVFLIAIIATLLTSCSPYQKLLKSSDYNLKYEKAVEYYNNEDYYRAQTLFDEIVPIFKGTNKSEKIMYLYADCHYKQRDYILAAYYFDNYAKTFPFADSTQVAQYYAAYCYYLNSPKPSLDQSDTYKAINAMQDFINKYPKNIYVEQANNYIELLRAKLEQKAYDNARLYYKLGDYQSASIALKNNLKDFPDTQYREDILYLLVKSSFLLAENSIAEKQGERYQATIAEYYNFIDEFPQSDFTKEIEKMYTKSVNQIKKL